MNHSVKNLFLVYLIVFILAMVAGACSSTHGETPYPKLPPTSDSTQTDPEDQYPQITFIAFQQAGVCKKLGQFYMRRQKNKILVYTYPGCLGVLHSSLSSVKNEVIWLGERQVAIVEGRGPRLHLRVITF